MQWQMVELLISFIFMICKNKHHPSASGPFFWAIKTYFVTTLLGKEDGRVVGQHAALGYRHAGQQMFDPGGGLEVPGCLPANDAELLVVPG